MFDVATNKLSIELTNIKKVISWQEQLRAAIYSPGTALIDLDNEALLQLQEQAPSKVAWQLFDHCAAVSRIYGLFEQAVGELVAEYIEFVPTATPDYSGLLEETRIQYRLGVAQILSKWKSSKSLYSHLSEDVIAAGLADGLRNKSYSLIADAFLIDSDNYRTDTINRIFKRLGFDDVFAGIRKASSIAAFCSKLGSESADSYLNEFVRVRNDAAHGNVASVSSSTEILNYAEFVELVIKELAVFLITRIIRDGVSSGHSVRLGGVLHVFSKNVVGVSSASEMTIKTGDRLYAGKKKLESVTVISLRAGNTEHSEIKLFQGFEFGLGLDKKILLGDDLFYWP